MPDLTISAELLRRYDRPGPRYTSYPTAVEFHTDHTAADHAERLQGVEPGTSLSLYVHIPFCERRCLYCACNVVATRKREVVDRYLSYLEREMELLAAYLPAPAATVQLHLGGGTPTCLSPAQLHQVHRMVTRRFPLRPDAEVAVEVDPRVTTREHVDRLAALGFNRLSLGVQDLTPEVQEAIGRHQDESDTRELFHYCRKQGFGSINLDLIYGLPGQNTVTFARNLAAVIDLRPDRIALYSYAHVPWVKAHQKRIDTSLLPQGMAKLELFAQGIQAFREAGYRQIGMDHFALPEDELSRALAERRLHRNFMGYTVHRTPAMVGAGITAISDVCGAYAQNRKKLTAYYHDLDAGLLPVERGIGLSRDDLIRRHVITQLMCNGVLHCEDVEHRFGIGFNQYFARELAELRSGPCADGLLQLAPGIIEATPLGHLFIRNIAMVFDCYLRRKDTGQPAFSRTV